jgi:aminoglycoside 2'-N-acetyltransferase I
VREAVLVSTLEMLTEQGFEAIELPEIARRAGVHSTTIYRRWGTKSRLVGEALLERASSLTATPDTGALRTDLERLLVKGTALLRTPPVRALFEVLLDEPTDTSAEIAEARDRFWTAHVDEARVIVDRAVARRELPAGTDPATLVEMLIGPAIVRILLMGEELSSPGAADIVRRALPGFVGDRARLRRVATADLTAPEIAEIRRLLWAAFGPGEEGMTEDDWEHALGGTHFVLDLDGEIVTHASVVERMLRVDGRPVRTGYVEAVATAPDRQGMGFGSRTMTDVGAYIRDRFELGVLGTGRHSFYERLGWRTWAGPASVRMGDGLHRTPDEDGYILVLTTPSSPPLDLSTPISCEWRPGDVW